MAEAKSIGPETDASPATAHKAGRFLSVNILSRFMRITYGAQAIPETQRRITAYSRSAKFELAEIWQRVLAQLTGYDPSSENRHVVKAKRSLKVKT